GAQRMIKRETDRLLLLRFQAFEERGDQGLRTRGSGGGFFSVRSSQGCEGLGGGQSGRAGHGGFQKIAASDFTTTLAIAGMDRLSCHAGNLVGCPRNSYTFVALKLGWPSRDGANWTPGFLRRSMRFMPDSASDPNGEFRLAVNVLTQWLQSGRRPGGEGF